VYLSNAEKEALFLTGYGDVPPWAVQQGLEQAVARGTYVPGEESLRIRLADALDLEERLAEAAQTEQASAGQEAPGGLLVGEGDTTAEQVADYLAFPGGYEDRPGDDDERMRLVSLLHQNAAAPEQAPEQAPEGPQEAPEGPQEAPEVPPSGGWRSPLEIVTEGAEEAEQEATRKEVIEDRDFSSFTKAELVAFAFDQFGAKLDRQASKDRLVQRVQELVDQASG
jgi:hypothetical protein